MPYKQDRRMGATHCVFCGRENPCWGHVNDFDEAKLKRLFEGLTPIRTSFVGQTKDRTNAVSAHLMRKARNPWGTYEQDEACVHCGKKLIQPSGRTVIEAVYARVASTAELCAVVVYSVAAYLDSHGIPKGCSGYLTLNQFVKPS